MSRFFDYSDKELFTLDNLQNTLISLESEIDEFFDDDEYPYYGDLGYQDLLQDKEDIEKEIETRLKEQRTKREYQEYLDYMYHYEEENGYYPMHLSNGQWTPYSESEYLDKTKNGTEKLNF